MLNRETYEAAFERFASGLPAAQRAPRGVALQRFLQIGLPGKTLEAWKYTDLQALDAEPVELPGTTPLPDTARWLLDGLQTRTWINGREPRSTTAIEVAAPSFDGHAHDGLAALNAAFALPGLDLQVADGEALDAPLQALFITQPLANGEMVHLRHRIRLGENARASVVLHEAGLGELPRWSTHLLDVDLAAGAQLQLIRVQDESAATRGWFEARARIGSNASLGVTQVDLGGGIMRSDWRPSLVAAGAEVVLRGLLAPVGRAHSDCQFLTEHAAPHGRSRQVFRGLAWDRARGVFNGKVIVRPGAQKTDSEQRIANLLLSPRAEINAKPELEIYADDVKCAHGATFGRLDPAALFYLRARGVPESAARSLLIHSFANEVLQHLEPPALRKAVTGRLLERIGGGINVEALV
jgi:Fe-S cluster assembly protein SufD